MLRTSTARSAKGSLHFLCNCLCLEIPLIKANSGGQVPALLGSQHSVSRATCCDGGACHLFPR